MLPSMIRSVTKGVQGCSPHLVMHFYGGDTHKRAVTPHKYNFVMACKTSSCYIPMKVEFNIESNAKIHV